MTVSHRYRNFGGSKKSPDVDEDPNLEALEDQKLQAFEAGYQAGWDDAVKAHADEKEKISNELGQNLQEMSFTYHEAMSKFAVSMEPVVQEILDKLLPEIVKNALGAHILQQLKELMTEQISHPIEIVVAPENVDAVKTIAGGNLTSPFDVISEASLGAGQAFVRVGDNEQQINLDALVSDVSEAFRGFFHEAEKGISK